MSVRVLASPFVSAGHPGIWSAREIGTDGCYGREVMVNRNYAKPIGGGPMRPVSLFHKVPIQKAYDAGGIAGITDEWRQMPLISKIVIGAAGVVFAYLAIAKLPKD